MLFPLFNPHETITEQETEAGLRAVVQDGLCSQTMGTLTSGVFLVGFALALGASNTTIGLLAGLPFLVNLVQLPTVYLVERVGIRKAVVVISNIIGRTALLAVAAVPFLPTPAAALGGLIACFFVHVVCNGIAGSAWNSWMRDLVPEERLGTFFGGRLFYMTALSAALGLGGGLAIDGWQIWEPAHPVGIYSIFVAVGAVAGLIGLHYLSITPEPRMEAAQSRVRLGELLSRPFKDHNFRRLVIFLGSWNFAANLAAPFFTVYMLTRLDLGMSFVVIMTVLTQAANLVVVRMFGRLADRFSNKSILAVCGPIFILGIFAWTFTTLPEKYAGTIPLLVAIHLLLGFSTAGVTLASSNITLKLAPKGNATSYMAAISLVTSLAAGVAPIIGGHFADFFLARELTVNVQWTSPVTKLSFTTLSLRHWDFFFILATILGLYSLHRLTLIEEVGAVSERVVLNEMKLEANRIVRNLSTVAGLRSLASFPITLLRRPRSRPP